MWFLLHCLVDAAAASCILFAFARFGCATTSLLHAPSSTISLVEVRTPFPPAETVICPRLSFEKAIVKFLPKTRADKTSEDQVFSKLADAKDVMQAVHNLGGIRLKVLTPNLKIQITKTTINGKIYIQIEHWMLVAINTSDQKLYFFDPQRCKIEAQKSLKDMFDTAIINYRTQSDTMWHFS